MRSLHACALRRLAAVFLLAMLAARALAEDYPSKPVRVFVPSSPGGASDVAARLLGAKLAELLGQPFIVENRVTAGGLVGTEQLARSAPDGYSILVTFDTFAANPYLFADVHYDPVKDFAPISQVFVAANVLAVPSELPVKSVADLVALAKAGPGKLSYGHAGVGTSQHLAAELFKHMAHVEIASVPYRGTTALMPDLLAGRITMSFANIVNVVPLARQGKLRALAITSIKRSPLAPELPTMAESGYPGFEAVPWFGLVAPAGTPQGIIDKLHAETVKTLALPEVRRKFDELGIEPVGNTPAEFAAVIRKEIPEWAKVIKDAGIKLSN